MIRTGFGILLALTCLNYLPAFAEDSNFAKAQKTWARFQECGKQKSHNDIDNCINETLAPKMDSLVKQKMTEYVMMGFKFSDLHECNDKDSIQPVKPPKDMIFYCLDVLGHRSRASGYASFEKHRDQLRLTTIRYSF